MSLSLPPSHVVSTVEITRILVTPGDFPLLLLRSPIRSVVPSFCLVYFILG